MQMEWDRQKSPACLNRHLKKKKKKQGPASPQPLCMEEERQEVVKLWPFLYRWLTVKDVKADVTRLRVAIAVSGIKVKTRLVSLRLWMASYLGKTGGTKTGQTQRGRGRGENQHDWFIVRIEQAWPRKEKIILRLNIPTRPGSLVRGVCLSGSRTENRSNTSRARYTTRCSRVWKKVVMVERTSGKFLETSRLVLPASRHGF